MVSPQFLFEKDRPIGGRKSVKSDFFHRSSSTKWSILQINDNLGYFKNSSNISIIEIEFSVFSSLRDTVYFTYVLFSLSHHQPFLSLSLIQLYDLFTVFTCHSSMLELLRVCCPKMKLYGWRCSVSLSLHDQVKINNYLQLLLLS